MACLGLLLCQIQNEMPRIGHLNPPSLFTYRKAYAVCVSCASSPEFALKDLYFLLGSLGSCIPIACSGVESSTQTLLLECWILLMMMMMNNNNLYRCYISIYIYSSIFGFVIFCSID